jgi:hypothetical protein
MSFANYPPPNTPLTGAELVMIAQSQSNQLVTCTATVAEIAALASALTPAQFGTLYAAWFASLPTSISGQAAGAFVNIGGLLQQVQP